MLAAARPALSTDAQSWVDDHDGYSFTTPGNGDSYRALVVAHPAIADAMDYDSRITDAQTAIWDAIDAAVELGYVADLTDPTAHPASGLGYTDLTRAEALASYGAKIAHMFWLDITGAVPWRLYDYSETELRLLVDTDELYTIWDPDGATPARFLDFCDHSPKRAYDIISPLIVGTVSRRNGIAPLIPWLQRYSHGSSSGADSQTLDEGEISLDVRGGCHPATRLMAAGARSVNIATKGYVGKFAGAHTGVHRNPAMMVGPGDGLVLSHGDDGYSATFAGLGTDHATGASPGVRRCAEFTVWDPLVGQETDDDLLNLYSLQLQATDALRWITPWTVDKFPATGGSTQGWRYVSGPNWGFYHPPFLTVAEQSGYYDNLVEFTGVDGLDDKRSPSNTGYLGSLDPVTGPTTISSDFTVYELKDHTGMITVDADHVTIRNCKITNAGSHGISIVSGVSDCRIEFCEITGCGGWAITGMPSDVEKCYIHDNNGTGAILLQGAAAQYERTDIRMNYIECDSQNGIQSSSASQWVWMRFNTIESSGGVRLIRIDGTPVDGYQITRNWLDGAGYAISRDHSASVEIDIDNNWFGRSSTSGLFQDVTGPAPTWTGNVYEDDDSTANQTDTAPL